MAGFRSYGAYVPLHRIDRAEFNRAWGGFPLPGERSVASYDEDSMTMAVEAAIDCLRGFDAKSVDGLYFATTTSPYKERLCASIIAAALDMRSDIRVMDTTGTLRAGTIAIGAALDAVNAGGADSVLVVVADCRMGAPAGTLEQALGDGAAALLVVRDGAAVEVRDSYSISDDFSGMWRADQDQFVRSWEDRMAHDVGYSAVLPRAMIGVMEKCGLSSDDVSKVVYDSPTDMRRHLRIAGELKIPPAKVQDSMFLTVGNTGSALASMMLVAALEEAKAGDTILFASHGNGADAFVLDVTPAIEAVGQRRAIARHLESKRMVKNYETYLRWRDLVTLEAAQRPPKPPTSLAALWRSGKDILCLYGVRCLNCGTPQYSTPTVFGGGNPTRVCVSCRAKDQFEPYCFADKKGTICTFTLDHLAASPDPPAAVSVIDFEGGGRAVFEMTDRDPDRITVGMPLEMTFRKLYTDRGIHNYYWKTRPVRC